MQLAQQGIPYEQYMQLTGMSEEKLIADAMEPAARQVRMDLTVEAIIKAENLEASDEEVEPEYTKLAEQYGMDIEMLKKYIDAPSMYQQLMNEKAIAVVVDNAKPIKPAKKTAKKEDGEAAEAAEESEKSEKPAKKPAAKKTAKKAE